MKKQNKKPLIAIAALAIVGIVGVTIAYFTNSETFENIFSTKKFSTTIKENFESPDNWVPGTTANKTVEVKNEGNVEVVVRAKIDEEKMGWYNGNTKLDLEDKVTINFANFTDENATWTAKQADGYYYYKKVVKAGETTTGSFIESVTFDADATLSESDLACTYTYTYKNTTTGETTTGSSETAPAGTKVISKEKNCETKSNSYAGATYKMNIIVETMQYDGYNEADAWGSSAPSITK